VRALRAIVLFTMAIAFAYVAGWQVAGDGLALPAGVASAAAALLAIA
jgi:hypothetical protein